MKPTLWQKFWRSPWTYLAMWLLIVPGFFTDHGFWLVITWVNSFVLLTLFAIRGDQRWGNP